LAFLRSGGHPRIVCQLAGTSYNGDACTTRDKDVGERRTVALKRDGIAMAQELFTLTTLSTFAGATAATLVVGNTLQSVFNLSAKWVSLVVAEAILLLVAFFTGTTEVSGYFVGVLNGCLVYSSAVGLNTMTSKPRPSNPPAARSANETGPPSRPTVPRRAFFSRWW
jgi:hypothetical protein